MTYDFDLIAIGGGAAGLTAAGVAANLGAKALLIERERLGGDCTWYGCVPSKTLLRAAGVAHQMRHAGHYGLTDTAVRFDFGALMAHVRATREAVYRDADHPDIYERMGVTVRHGRARFVDPHTLAIEADGSTRHVSGRYVVIATGARAAVPAIDGLAGMPYLTNETLFELEEQPGRLAILGGGPIGVEMAQAFARLGTEVTVVEAGPRLLHREDAELAGMLQETLAGEGVRFVTRARVHAARRDGGVVLHAEQDGRPLELRADALLVATGRRPNVEALGLDAAGVDTSARGIPVDAHGRTNQPHIYAVGDVTGGFQFTHMSEHTAKIAVARALLKLPLKIDHRHVPRVTYTDPELAHVGATEARLQKDGTTYDVYRFPYAKIDRAITDGATNGLIKVFAKRWNGRILGAGILGARAGELIGEYALAMRHGITLRQISDTIHPYPTYGLGVRRAADQWYIQRQSPFLVRLTQKLFGYRGPVLSYGPDDVV